MKKIKMIISLLDFKKKISEYLKKRKSKKIYILTGKILLCSRH